ncbi:hypothetical protein AB3G45_00895 [Shinella sp. S4-D37]|uniref:hypothetical protein n=1 Tax=Shinella sp. S4-D37 TaxID=3161999 RepID=UPI0034674EE6
MILVAIATGGLLIGLVLSWQAARCAHLVWSAATLAVLARLLLQVFSALRRGEVGLDIVAALSMSAAIAFGEPLAGNVVGLMYAGGQLLESFAEGRARRSCRIALQSVSVGLTLSVGAMVAAACGYLQPVEGAILQEAIDVAVILNALRAL